MTDDLYFSETAGSPPQRDQEEIGPEFWAGFAGFIRARLGDGSFAESFPLPCYDTALPTECDGRALAGVFQAENPGIPWPLDGGRLPKTLQALDCVEFFARHISRVTQRSAHTSRSWGHQHDHLTRFDRASGLSEYVGTVDTLFRRCRHPYEIRADGRVVRCVPPALAEPFLRAVFQTSDADLDRLLNSAREKFINPDPRIRGEGLEKLWDAWERLKTVIPGKKTATVPRLVEQAVPEPRLRTYVEEEAEVLTRIGNNFMIRHSETDRPRIEHPDQVDYLFHRMFALIYLLLRARRGVQ